MSAPLPDLAHGRTHDVTNQPTPFEDVNLYTSDTALGEAVSRFGGDWGADRLRRFGALAGGDMLRWGVAANLNKPVLKAFDRYGHRIDEVEFHPAYHELMRTCVEHGLHALPWQNPQTGAHVVRSAMGYLHGQAEAGTGCPITMTFASVPALRHQPDIAERWLPGILSSRYDPNCQPASGKAGLTIGMGMTEKQGGSDVRANTTIARPVGKAFELTGHKWFFSAPMCDAFLVLAQAPDGLSCFLLPKWRPDGSRNAIHIQRLKDKLGNWANASSEVEFHGAYAQRVGAPGRGVATIIEMVMHTRLDCITGSAALMRQAFAQAAWHARQREAFGKRLWDQPLMRNVLTDLAIESEAAMLTALRIASALDAAQAGDTQAAAFARIATAIGKYWVCKRAPMMVNEAQECLGGAGYVEEHPMARLYREAPLNSIWEGCGNIQCLDVLRALAREPGSAQALMHVLEQGLSGETTLLGRLEQVQAALKSGKDIEFRARQLVEDLALLWQASELKSAHAPSFEAFVAGRLDSAHRAFGTLPPGVDTAAILDRAAPVV